VGTGVKVEMKRAAMEIISRGHKLERDKEAPQLSRVFKNRIRLSMAARS
jgi:hypothetical protein